MYVKRGEFNFAALAMIDNPFFFFYETKERTIYGILRQNTRREKYCVWSWLTDQNFGKLKTDNTIFYATISSANNICIERKIFRVVTLPFGFHVLPHHLSVFRHRQFHGGEPILYLEYSTLYFSNLPGKRKVRLRST